MRGAGGVALQFKKYPMEYIRILNNNFRNQGPAGKMAGLMMLTALLGSSGLMGLPFIEDAINIYDGISNWIRGIDPMSEYSLHKFITEMGASPEWAEAALRGPSRSFLGVDLSQRIGQGQILPEANPLLSIPVAGAVYGKIKEYQEREESGQPAGAAIALLSPILGKGPADILRGLTQLPSEGYRSQKGDIKVPQKDITGGQIAAKALGFQPAKFATIQEEDRSETRLKFKTKKAEDRLNSKLSGLLANSISARDAGDDDTADAFLVELQEAYRNAADTFSDESVPLEDKVKPPSIKTITNRAVIMIHPDLAVKSVDRFKRKAFMEMNQSYPGSGEE
jgi:hypothetical protein